MQQKLGVGKRPTHAALHDKYADIFRQDICVVADQAQDANDEPTSGSRKAPPRSLVLDCGHEIKVCRDARCKHARRCPAYASIRVGASVLWPASEDDACALGKPCAHLAADSTEAEDEHVCDGKPLGLDFKTVQSRLTADVLTAACGRTTAAAAKRAAKRPREHVPPAKGVDAQRTNLPGATADAEGPSCARERDVGQANAEESPSTTAEDKGIAVLQRAAVNNEGFAAFETVAAQGRRAVMGLSFITAPHNASDPGASPLAEGNVSAHFSSLPHISTFFCSCAGERACGPRCRWLASFVLHKQLTGELTLESIAMLGAKPAPAGKARQACATGGKAADAGAASGAPFSAGRTHAEPTSAASSLAALRAQMADLQRNMAAFERQHAQDQSTAAPREGQ